MSDQPHCNLISIWLEFEFDHRGVRSLKEVADCLNSALGRNYEVSRLREWEQAKRAPDRLAHTYILRRALPHALNLSVDERSVLSNVDLDRLSQFLSLPGSSDSAP